MQLIFKETLPIKLPSHSEKMILDLTSTFRLSLKYKNQNEKTVKIALQCNRSGGIFLYWNMLFKHLMVVKSKKA